MAHVLTRESLTPTRWRPREWAQSLLAQPQRLALGAILALSAFLELFRLERVGYANTYYAATVRSMLTGWRDFFFVSYDPGGFVSVDKPPVGFWLQAASAKLLGFSGVSLLLPEALATVASVALLYVLVRRAWGVTAGLLAALALAVTPISVVTGRNNTIDSVLVLTLLGAAWAMLRANRTGQLRWLLASMALVGLGFNVKMLEAYLALPALAALYLVGTRTRGWRLIGHGALATLVLVVVSLSWVTAVDLTPASSRPYVGSSSSNSALELALGYNGLQRLLGRSGNRGFGANSAQRVNGPAVGGLPAAGESDRRTRPATGEFSDGNRPEDSEFGAGAQPADSEFGATTRTDGAPDGRGGGVGGAGENGPKGVLRLLNSELGPQVSWILPLALVGLLAGAWQTRLRRRLPLNRPQQMLVLWGVWFVTGATFFSVASFYHRYYMVTMAPSIAALAGIGVVALVRDFGRRRWRGWLLPCTLLATAGTQLYLLRDAGIWRQRLEPVIVGGAVLAALTLIGLRLARWRRPRARQSRGVAWAVALALLALLAAPTIWGGYTLHAAINGTLPVAGPAQAGDGGQGGFGGFSGFRTGGFGAVASQTNQRLIAYLQANRGSARYLVAVDSSMSASSIILATGDGVMALGGFSGNDPILTTDQLAALVAKGTVRFFLGNTSNWVQQNCKVVPASNYGAISNGVLYDCAGMATGG